MSVWAIKVRVLVRKKTRLSVTPKMRQSLTHLAQKERIIRAVLRTPHSAHLILGWTDNHEMGKERDLKRVPGRNPVENVIKNDVFCCSFLLLLFFQLIKATPLLLLLVV